MTDKIDVPPIACTPKRLDRHLSIRAGENASAINPTNHPLVSPLVTTPDGTPLTSSQIAILTSKYWGARGVSLSVGFLDNDDPDFHAKVLRHMNAWANDPRSGATPANIVFYATDKAAANAQVRIATAPGGGHWSYIGTDVLLIPAGQPTMNLDGFSAATSEEELCRVVRHETGHTLGCPHEHMRGELIALLDEKEVFRYYLETEGWSEAQTRAQLLTPLEERSLMGTPRPDALSIMCYQIPGSLTTNGKPILGGLDIDRSDFDFIERMYPRPVAGAATAAAPVAASASAAAPQTVAAPVRTSAAPRDRKPFHPADCIVVTRPDGVVVSIPPEAPAAQVRQVLRAMD